MFFNRKYDNIAPIISAIPANEVTSSAFSLFLEPQYIGIAIDKPSGILCKAIAIASFKPKTILCEVVINVAIPSKRLCIIKPRAVTIPTLYILLSFIFTFLSNNDAIRFPSIKLNDINNIIKELKK